MGVCDCMNYIPFVVGDITNHSKKHSLFQSLTDASLLCTQEAPITSTYTTHTLPDARNLQLGIQQPDEYYEQWQQPPAPSATSGFVASKQDTAERLQAFDAQHVSTRDTEVQRLLGGPVTSWVLSAKAAATFPSLTRHFE